MATTLCFLALVGSIIASDPQRPIYHIMPPTSWSNDPNGPMLFNGVYHNFFQWNPDSVGWGTMVWGHAVSKDLAHWTLLPIALGPTTSYNAGGVWTGSTTIMSDGTPVVVYTCVVDGVQRQCTAVPSNLDDPYLTNWTYPGNNPIIKNPPSGVPSTLFRDPTSAWKSSFDGEWKIIFGGSLNNVGTGLVYTSKDFVNWNYVHPISNIPMGNMWECPDFFPMGNKFILKISIDNPVRADHYVVGNFDEKSQKFTPETGILPLDGGNVYASKSFPENSGKFRRILWSWLQEDQNSTIYVKRGWAGFQSIPKILSLDPELNRLVQTPAPELGKLQIYPGRNLFGMETAGFFNLNYPSTAATFKLNFKLNSSCNVDALVKVSPDRSKYTRVGIRPTSDPRVMRLVVDRSNSRSDGNLSVQFSEFSLKSTDFQVEIHIFLDHSVVEAFAMGGRAVVSSRVYTPDEWDGLYVDSQKLVQWDASIYRMHSCWTNL